MPMNGGQGIKQVGYFDCAGGGQVVVDGTVAFIAHMHAPEGTTIVDVSDPSKPRRLSTIEVPKGMHSHKVRAANGVMLVNREAQPADRPAPGFQGGIGIFDVSDPSRPREITFWRCGGAGVHRFTFDGRYAYLSPELDGYVGNIVMILDIEDMSRPRLVSGLDWSPPFACPTHTALPVPFALHGRRVMVVSDEDVAKLEPSPPSFLWLVDITDEAGPVPFASFQVAGVDGTPQPPFTGCHQPCEEVTGTEIPVAWFAHGLRIVDIADPHAPREVASFLPAVPEGEKRVCSNDVCVDERGLIYLIDRGRGLSILERA